MLAPSVIVTLLCFAVTVGFVLSMLVMLAVAVCGGGGGGTNREGKTGNHQADNGTTSNFGNLIAASGGTGAYYSGGYYEDT